MNCLHPQIARLQGSHQEHSSKRRFLVTIHAPSTPISAPPGGKEPGSRWYGVSTGNHGLTQPHVIAGDIRYVGKETDRKWEEGEDISVLDFAATEYGRTGGVLASEEVKNQIKGNGINKCPRESGFDRKNFIRKLVRDVPVKRTSYGAFGTHRRLDQGQR